MARVLVIGSGGREQALAWKLAQSKSVTDVYITPGNAGSKGKVKNAPIAFDDVSSLLDFAQKHQIDLTVVGQEAASEAGVVDAFRAAGLRIFGPNKAAVRVESSKAFSKQLMTDAGIPTAAYEVFDNADRAKEYAVGRPRPIVIKADGLATGKGVVIATEDTEIESAIDDIMVRKIFGASGNRVVIEDFLDGQEVSMHALCDGRRTAVFPASQDHKQIFDGDKGPNTGGMGVIAPVPWVAKEHVDFVRDRIVLPALQELSNQNSEFTGCLYPGLMIDGDTIKLLEFNARFGDPEAQVYMRLLDGDLYEILSACAVGKLDPESIAWKRGYAVVVVLCSGGYPGKYQKGVPINGIEEAEKLPGVEIFHAGTDVKEGQVVTNGGRVLGVTAIAETLDGAINSAYAAVRCIHFEGMHYRTDIGRRNSR